MRHIPEAELHAYLDQALNRTQCVEIERHLDACPACRTERDDIAALRDRTTALLSRMGPATVSAPSFELIQSRTAAERAARRRRMQLTAWAASLALAVSLGWIGGSVFESSRETDKAGQQVSLSTPSPTPSPAKASAPKVASSGSSAASTVPAAMSPARPRAPAKDLVRPKDHVTAPERSGKPTRLMEPVSDLSLGPENASPEPVMLASGPKSTEPSGRTTDGDLVFDSTWRAVSWDGAQAAAGGKAPPHIDGLPVMEVQVQKKAGGKRPVTVVAQQLASGEVIHTIEGPASDVSKLLGRRTMTDPVPARIPRIPIDPARPGQVGQAMAMQRGGRMIVITGALPPDSLRAIVRQLTETGKR